MGTSMRVHDLLFSSRGDLIGDLPLSNSFYITNYFYKEDF